MERIKTCQILSPIVHIFSWYTWFISLCGSKGKFLWWSSTRMKIGKMGKPIFPLNSQLQGSLRAKISTISPSSKNMSETRQTENKSTEEILRRTEIRCFKDRSSKEFLKRGEFAHLHEKKPFYGKARNEHGQLKNMCQRAQRLKKQTNRSPTPILWVHLGFLLPDSWFWQTE